jgi:hypothetical protein
LPVATSATYRRSARAISDSSSLFRFVSRHGREDRVIGTKSLALSDFPGRSLARRCGAGCGLSMFGVPPGLSAAAGPHYEALRSPWPKCGGDMRIMAFITATAEELFGLTGRVPAWPVAAVRHARRNPTLESRGSANVSLQAPPRKDRPRPRTAVHDRQIPGASSTSARRSHARLRLGRWQLPCRRPIAAR